MKLRKFRSLAILMVTALLIFILALPFVQGALAAEASTEAQALGSGRERISFARGATSAEVSGRLNAWDSDRYILRALAGQLMEVNLSAPEGTSITVTTASGRSLAPVVRSDTAFRGYLPSTGDYLIEVETGRRAADYSLVVTIPERVSFARGATSALLEGDLEAHQSHDYVLKAFAGQLLEVVGSPDDNLQLTIYGADGTVLRSGMGEGASFRGRLPLSQDYLVRVRAGDRDVSYSLNVIIPARISFERGAVSGSASGWVGAHQSQYYVLRAMKGQDMRVRVASDEKAQLIIYGEDGTVLKSGMGEGARFNGELPSTQDYILVVRAGERGTSYTVQVTIR